MQAFSHEERKISCICHHGSRAEAVVSLNIPLPIQRVKQKCHPFVIQSQLCVTSVSAGEIHTVCWFIQTEFRQNSISNSSDGENSTASRLYSGHRNRLWKYKTFYKEIFPFNAQFKKNFLMDTVVQKMWFQWCSHERHHTAIIWLIPPGLHQRSYCPLTTQLINLYHTCLSWAINSQCMLNIQCNDWKLQK